MRVWNDSNRLTKSAGIYRKQTDPNGSWVQPKLRSFTVVCVCVCVCFSACFLLDLSFSSPILTHISLKIFSLFSTPLLPHNKVEFYYWLFHYKTTNGLNPSLNHPLSNLRCAASTGHKTVETQNKVFCNVRFIMKTQACKIILIKQGTNRVRCKTEGKLQTMKQTSSTNS